MTLTHDNFTRDELASVLDLQARAYETLLWLANIAYARPEMVTERTAAQLRDPAACRAWVTRFHAQIPARLRPADETEAGPFARLFSSFFQTSFRMEHRVHDGRSHYVIALNKDAAAGPQKLDAGTVPRGLKRKRRGEAEALQHEALLLLNGGRDDADYWAAFAAAARDSALHKDLLVWTYACALVDRARDAAPGAAVHEIWRQIGRDTRRRLTADRVQRSRERLEGLLRGTTAPPTQYVGA